MTASRLPLVRLICCWLCCALDAVPVGELKTHFFPHLDQQTIVLETKQQLAKHKLAIFGGLYHVTDGARLRQELDWSDTDFDSRLMSNLLADRELGCEYITFQLHLPPKVGVHVRVVTACACSAWPLNPCLHLCLRCMHAVPQHGRRVPPRQALLEDNSTAH